MDPGLLRREPSGRCRQGLLHPAESARWPGRDKRDPPRVRIPRRVIKCGSHLCAPSYCRRYRSHARHAGAVDTLTSYLGFRCVWREGQGAGAYHGAPAGSRRAPAASAASAIGRATAGTMGTLSDRTPSPALPSAPRCQLSVGLRRRAYHGRRADCGEAMVNTGRPRMHGESGIERATARAEAYRIIGDPRFRTSSRNRDFLSYRRCAA